MTDDELELLILERYAARHEEAEIADPQRSDKCLRELDLRTVLRDVAGLDGPQLEYHAERWLGKLAPPSRPGHRQGPLRRCSGREKGAGHRFHARAFFATGGREVSVWDRINELRNIIPAQPARIREPTVAKSETIMRLFITHASHDVALAGRVADLLKSALNLPASAIRCTSVDGYRLRGGVQTDQQLRHELRTAEAFVGILSTASLQSQYVLAELGARWVLEKHLLPLLAPGTPPSVIGGPLAGYNALRADNASQLHQMVEEIAEVLRLTPDRGSAYQRHVEEILALPPSSQRTDSPNVDATAPSPLRLSGAERDWVVSLGDAARELLMDAARDKNGVVIVVSTMDGDSVRTNEREFVDHGGRPVGGTLARRRARAFLSGCPRRPHRQGRDLLCDGSRLSFSRSA